MKTLTIALWLLAALFQCCQSGILDADIYDGNCTVAGQESVGTTLLDRVIRRMQQSGSLKIAYNYFKNRMDKGPLGARLGATAIDPTTFKDDETFDFSRGPTQSMPAYLARFLAVALGSGKTVYTYLWKYGFVSKVLNLSEREGDEYQGSIPPCAITNAIREFQIFNNLQPADGKLTKQTIKKMAEDRCGNKDVKCTTPKCLADDRYNGKSDNLRKRRYAVRHKKWRGSRSGNFNIAYYFENFYNATSTQANKTGHDTKWDDETVKREVEKGLYEWTKYSGLNFIETKKARRADVKIRFGTGDHGEKNDARWFDGLYGVLAHMYYPRDGEMHFDEAENWTTAYKLPGINLQVVTAHEMGHGLGIEHSNIPGALMSPFYIGWREQLTRNDDIRAVRHLYGVGNGMVIPRKSAPLIAPEGLALGIEEGQKAVIRKEGNDTDSAGELKEGEGEAEEVETVTDRCAKGDTVTFQESKNLGHCISEFTAGFSDPDEEHIYLFYNDNNYIVLESGHKNLKFPKVKEPETAFAEMLVSDKFPGMEGPYDAAVTDSANRISYFFVNDTVTSWDWSTDQVGSLNREPIENTMFAGLPNTAIHAVAKYLDQFIFFCGDEYYIFTPDHDGEEHSVQGPFYANLEEETIANAFDSFYNGYIYTTIDSYKNNNIYNLIKAKKVTAGASSAEDFSATVMRSYSNIDMDDDTMFGWPCGLGFCGTEIDWETSELIEQ
ncbi:hypothetical protein ACHWQZ_G005883 [Mnemiopsis leidyi]